MSESTDPLHKPMMTDFEKDPYEQTSVRFQYEFKIVINSLGPSDEYMRQ